MGYAARFAKNLVTACAASLLLVQPVLAQSINVLRDAETEAFFRDISKPMIVAANLDPKSVQLILVGDPSINAFVCCGQNVFIHSGLIQVTDNVNQLQGVIAHELGHIAGGHNIRSSEGTGPATSISILSLIAAGAAMALGAGEAGMAILGMGQSVAQSTYLSFNRDQESRADQAGAEYLLAAQLSGQGSLDFFGKLANQEYRLAIPQTNSYNRTHPLSSERIAALADVYAKSPYFHKGPDPAFQARFLRIKGKLIGFIEDPVRTLAMFPASDQSVQARYARAYAWQRSAYPDAALGEINKLLATAPKDPYFLELKGQILLESGRNAEAITVLRAAVANAPNEPLIATLLGHALISTEMPADMAEAKPLLKAAIARDKDNPFAWYQLGVIYDREGDTPRAALASAERYSMEGNRKGASANARVALAGLPRGSADWIRAQDIALASACEGNKKKC
ncbi:M48 family metalloprotease [Polymorphobacter arshaanensis]|nr:M48 family metalloprotease [Polymorphobacter arshaanensis]